MYSVSLKVENGFDEPRQAGLLEEELRDLSARIEDGESLTEEDVFLVGAFAGTADLSDDARQLNAILEELSHGFPDLVIAATVSSAGERIGRFVYQDGARVFAY